MPEIVIRLASAIVLAAVALGAAAYSPWSFVALVMAGAVIGAWEWGRLTRDASFDGTFVIEAVGVSIVAILVMLGRHDLALFVLVGAAVAIASVGSSANAIGWSLAGLAYAALPAWVLVWLRSDPSLGVAAILFLFAVAATTDTASYTAGSLIGGPKLAPSISPNKTWSGFLIGAAVPAIIGYAFALALGDTSPLRLSLVSVALALACQFGDLVESAAKRRFGAKDMSQLIPGHGGLLDRVDSLLLAAMLAGLIALRDPASPARGLLIW
jgi:phosphatidate cytidylyltransferase